jgi:hypothetical protein
VLLPIKINRATKIGDIRIVSRLSRIIRCSRELGHDDRGENRQYDDDDE